MGEILNNVAEATVLSRRSFLGLAGLGAAAVAGASALSGCSPSASSSGSASAKSSASASAEQADPIEPVSPPSSWTEEADVIVCGTGGGLLAGVYAAMAGKKVIMLEKANTWGGSSKETDIFSVMGTKTQQAIYGAVAEQMKAAGQEEMAAKVGALAAMEPEAMRQQWIAKYMITPGNGDSGELPDGTTGLRPVSVDQGLLNSLCNNIADSVDFMAGLGVPWGPVTEMGSAGMMAGVCPQDSEAGGFVARANYSVFELLYNKCVELGVDVKFETPAETLVVDGGRVVGVKSGESFFKAEDGVIMATGGMAQNKAMLAKYVPSVANRALTATASSMDTGEGILMGFGAGADMQGYDSSFCFDGGIDCGTWNHYLYKGDVQLARQPWLGVNIQGERYPYYPVDTLGFTHQCGVLMSQPGNRGYVIFDADYEENIKKFGQMICRNPIWPDMETNGNFDRLPESICEHDWRIGAQQGIDAGYIFQADTIEELAEKMGFVPGNLVAAVEGWNKICEAGEDPQFHYDPAWLVPVAKAPFYGMAVGATCLSTNCGMAVTPEMQAVAANGAPIEGLYAAGSCVGGVGGDSTYGDCRNPGGGVAMACGTAYAAAKAICGELA